MISTIKTITSWRSIRLAVIQVIMFVSTLQMSFLDVRNQEYLEIRVITKLPNSKQSYKGKVKTHKYINRQNQTATGKL